MKTWLRGASRALTIVPWPAPRDADAPLRVDGAHAAAALLRSFPGAENALALRTFLARAEAGVRLERLDDAQIYDEVARLLASGRALAFVEASAALVARDGEATEDAAPSSVLAERAAPKTWVEIVLTDMEGGPLPGVRYAITTPDETVHEGRLDARGVARVDGIDPGTCVITFPDFDEEAWMPRAS